MSPSEPWSELHHFWFGTLNGGIATEEIRNRWFVSDAGFDTQCQQFEPLLGAARRDELAAWLDSPLGSLAFVVLCDQMPRNIYRGSAQAFAWDQLAIDVARHGINRGFDLALAWDERAFFYMPFEHSESYLDQHTSVGLFSQLRDDVPKELKSAFGNTLRFAQKHRDIILQFGRFPHRNKSLERASTQAETEFAKQGDGFGQGSA